jgi:hypothetical protein
MEIEKGKKLKFSGLTYQLPDKLKYADLTEPEGYKKEVDKNGKPFKPGYVSERRRIVAPKQRPKLYVQQLEPSERDTSLYRILRDKIGTGGNDSERSSITDVQKG